MNPIYLIPMVFIWILITGAIAYSIYLKLKARKAYQEMYENALVAGDTEDFPPPKSLLRAIVSSKETWKMLFWAFTTAGFMMFIVEETMQIRGFGRYGLQQAKLWNEAANACNYSAKAVRRDRTIMNMLSLLNPPAGYVFKRYVDAEEKKLGWEMQRIEKELGKINSRVTLIENQLKIAPIITSKEVVVAKALIPDDIGKLSAIPAKPVFPIATADGGLSYPRQIDYTTHADRIERKAESVYVTKFGRKFHRLDCGTITGKAGVVKMPITEAIAEDKEPCLRCKP